MNHYYIYRHLAAQPTAPIAAIMPDQRRRDGAIMNVTGIGITRTSKHVDSAKLLIEFLVAQAGQKLFADLDKIPAAPDVKTDPALVDRHSFRAALVPLARLAELRIHSPSSSRSAFADPLAEHAYCHQSSGAIFPAVDQSLHCSVPGPAHCVHCLCRDDGTAPAVWLALVHPAPELLGNTLSLAPASRCYVGVRRVAGLGSPFDTISPGRRIWEMGSLRCLASAPPLRAGVRLCPPWEWADRRNSGGNCLQPSEARLLSPKVSWVTIILAPRHLSRSAPAGSKPSQPSMSRLKKSRASAGVAPWATLRRVTLPLIRPGRSGVGLVMLYVISDFGAVSSIRYQTPWTYGLSADDQPMLTTIRPPVS